MAIQITPELGLAWQFRISISKMASSTQNCSRPFIKPFKVNTLFSSPFLAVGVIVDNAKDNWQDGGEIAQDFSFLNSDSRYFDTAKSFYSVQKLLINRVSLIQFPLITDAYSLVYFPNSYFQAITLEIWEYAGDVTNTTEEQLQNLLNDFNALNDDVSAIKDDVSAIQGDLNSLELGLLLDRLIPILDGFSPPDNPTEPTPEPEPPAEEPSEPTEIDVTEEFYTAVNGILWLLN